MRHESSPCVLLGLNAAPPSVASVLPSGCIVQCLSGPIECCRRPYHFRPLAVVQEHVEQEAAAAAAAAGEAAGDHPDNDNNSINWEQRLAGKDSAAVFKCMQWDPDFETDECEIGWDDRFLGLMRKPLAKFKGDAIPWHRVVAFWYRGELVWSRRAKLQELLERDGK